MIVLKPSIQNFRGLFQRELIGLITIYVILVYFAGVENLKTLLPSMLSVFFIVEWAPALYFTWSYYRVNKGQEFKVDFNTIELKKSDRIEHTKDEIKEIEIFMSGINPRFNIAYVSMEFFHYAKIIMKNGEQLVITSICAEQVYAVLEKYLEDIPMKYNWGFPNISHLNKIKYD